MEGVDVRQPEFFSQILRRQRVEAQQIRKPGDILLCRRGQIEPEDLVALQQTRDAVSLQRAVSTSMALKLVRAQDETSFERRHPAYLWLTSTFRH